MLSKLNLNKREKITVYAGICFVLIFIFVQFIISPVFNRRAQLAGRLAVKTKILAEMKQLQAEYMDMENRVALSRQSLDRRPPGFTLFSFLES